MAAISLDKELTEKLKADWRTGAYSQQKLANKYSISKGAVNKLCKGLEQDVTGIVNAGVQYQQGLQGQDDRMVTAVTNAVDEITRYAKFFNQAALKNVSQAMAAPCNDQGDYRARADTIAKGREVVLGKTPDTVISNTNAQQTNPVIMTRVISARPN